MRPRAREVHAKSGVHVEATVATVQAIEQEVGFTPNSGVTTGPNRVQMEDRTLGEEHPLVVEQSLRFIEDRGRAHDFHHNAQNCRQHRRGLVPTRMDY